MNDLIQVSREGRVLRIALNRPDKRNALNIGLCGQLVTALDRADADPGIGAILLTGNGKSFCAGMDLSEVLSADSGAINEVQEQLFSIGARLTPPIVAAVHASALAGGPGLAANAQVVLAAHNDTLRLPVLRHGLWPFLIF